MKLKKSIFRSIILLSLTSFIFTGCKNNNLPVIVTPSLNEPDNNITPTNQVTETVVNEITPDQISFYGPNLSPSQTLEIQNSLEKYAVTNNFEFIVQNSLEVQNLKKSKLVFLTSEDDAWLATAKELSETNFILVSSKTYDLPKNVIQIQTSLSNLYFVAGYVSAQIADDWRVGAILPAESIDGSQLSDIFSNGTKFLCGLCAPLYAPVVFFPTIAIVSDGSDINAINSSYGEIAINRPNTIFIPSEFLFNDVAVNLKQNGHIILSDISHDSSKNDLMDIRIGFNVSDALNKILDSKIEPGTTIINAKILVQDMNNLLSKGKIDYLNIMITDLNQGYISPFKVLD